MRTRLDPMSCNPVLMSCMAEYKISRNWVKSDCVKTYRLSRVTVWRVVVNLCVGLKPVWRNPSPARCRGVQAWKDEDKLLLIKGHKTVASRHSCRDKPRNIQHDNGDSKPMENPQSAKRETVRTELFESVKIQPKYLRVDLKIFELHQSGRWEKLCSIGLPTARWMRPTPRESSFRKITHFFSNWNGACVQLTAHQCIGQHCHDTSSMYTKSKLYTKQNALNGKSRAHIKPIRG